MRGPPSSKRERIHSRLRPASRPAARASAAAAATIPSTGWSASDPPAPISRRRSPGRRAPREPPRRADSAVPDLWSGIARSPPFDSDGHGRRQGSRIVAQDRREQLGNRAALERPAAAAISYSSTPERPDVRTRIGCVAAYLFGRHRVRRPRGRARRHERCRRRRVGNGDVVAPRQAEIDNLQTPAGDDRVAGLEVAMDRRCARARGPARRRPGGRSDGTPANGSAPSSIRSRSERPFTYSMAMKAAPPTLPTSWIVQMCGWFRAAALRASRRSRALARRRRPGCPRA